MFDFELNGGDYDFGSAADNILKDTSWMNTVKPAEQSLWDKFMGGLSSAGSNLNSQLGKVATNAINNPLGALTAALGMYGSYKENTGGSVPAGTMDAVQQLMLKGDAQNAYTPQPVKYAQPVARDYRHFIQSYDKDGNATQESRNDALTNDTYQKVLGRNADVGGLKHWSGVMDRGMSTEQLENAFKSSPEFQLKAAYKELLGRNPDFDGQNFYTDKMNKGLRLDEVRADMANSPEMIMGHLYREELGRNPDSAGLQFYQDALKRGMSMDELRMALRNSAEGQKRAQPAPAAPIQTPPAPVGGLSQAVAPQPDYSVPTAVNKVPRKVFTDEYQQFYQE